MTFNEGIGWFIYGIILGIIMIYFDNKKKKDAK